MSKIQIPPKIRAENFKEEDREVASKIGEVYNPFVDQLYLLLQKNIGYDNLNRQLVTTNVVIGPTGTIINPPTVRYTLNSKVIGTNCINATCLTNNLQYPTGTPFVSFDLNNNTLIIKNVTNLQANSQYSLTLELIGE